MGVLDELTNNQRTQRTYLDGPGGQFNGGTFSPYAGILNPGGGLLGGQWQQANAINRPGVAPMPGATTTQTASNPLLPRPRPWDTAPSSMDVAAMRNPAVGAINNAVPGYQNPAMGYAPNGAGGMAPGAPAAPGAPQTSWLQDLLAGINYAMGGGAQPGAGQGRQDGAQPVTNGQFQGSKTGKAYEVGKTYQGKNGYTYVAQQDGTFKQTGRTDPAGDAARGAAIGEANRRNPNPTYNVSGSNNSFEPRSVQNSERWQTGY